MKFNFRQISALATSALMIGMTAGVAAAAAAPAPFVQNGVGDFAVVYGSAAPQGLDQTQATNIANWLQGLVSSGGDVSLSSSAVSLDTSSTRIWLNTSLNTARSSLTKTEMPNLLADTTFSGNVDARLTHTIKLQAGAPAGGDNSGKVIFARQPKTSNDPVIGVSLGTSATSNPLYNASVIFSKAVNFTSPDSENQEIKLFGQTFTVSTATDSSNIVLLKEAQTVTLTSDSRSASVTVGGSTYTIELVSASDTAATLKVTDSAGRSSTAEVDEGNVKKIQGLEVAVKNADETNFQLSATVIAGAQKVTLSNGNNVKVGSDDTSVDGTLVYIVGGTNSTTEIAIAVFAPSTSNDAIVAGSSFVDPVFGTFKLSFVGLSSPLDDPARESLSVGVVGDDTLSLTMTDHRGNTKTFDWAHNQSNQFFLGDDSNFTISVIEMANLTEDQYVVLGNEENGYLLQVDSVSNDSSTAGSDIVQFRDVLSGETIRARSPTTEGTTTLSLGGKEYTITYAGPGGGSGSGGSIRIKYPTSDSANSATFVVYPTIQTKTGALVALYQPLTLNLADMDGSGTDAGTFNFPDGDGYTSVTASLINGTAGNTTWSIGGNLLTTNAAPGNDTANVTVGRLTYSFQSTGADNQTKLYLVAPGASNVITTPAVVLFEGKDDNNNYEVVVIDTEPGDGTSTDGVGVNSVYLTSPTQYSATLQSDSDITKYVDWWGTLVTVDAGDSDQKTAEVAYPSSQVYAKLFVDSVGGTSTTNQTQSLGGVLVTDNEVASVGNKNLVVVGGSCINTVAASLVGGAYCGSAWTSATGVGSGQFLIQSFSRTGGKIALLVAGYEAAETAAAAQRLINQPESVDTTAGTKYIGTVGSGGTSTMSKVSP
ncbi:MAG: hypothetical protein KatS3mg001_428 [Candidatus Pacearchaeota archaeon]|nr:MAG: hypothetical protein KatS3mg001_428 [Candidatus Pacearchaeota archaeon]